MVKTLQSETTLDYVSPDLLDFDPNNPRFGGLMDNRTQDDIRSALFAEPYRASELVGSAIGKWLH